MKDLDFDGWWTGQAHYSCDCSGCKSEESFDFESEEEAYSKEHRQTLRNKGWITTKVNGEWHDFCCEECRNKYIKSKT